MQRKYSISEIDRMRVAISSGMSWSHGAKDTPIIEDRLRTHMLNGTEPEELEAAAKDFEEKWYRDFLEKNRPQRIQANG